MKLKKLKKKSCTSKLYKYINPCVSYASFKFNNKIYTIGDILLIKSTSINEDSIYNSIGKLIRIIPRNGISTTPNWPTIEVEWYYQKNELVKTEENALTNESYFNSISDDEVFQSNHRDIIFTECVISHAKVVSMEEYILSKSDNSLYFSRASYNPFNYQIKPDIRKWKKYCSCGMPFNPNLLYVKCDKCDEWYHLKCAGLSESDVSGERNFYCVKCS